MSDGIRGGRLTSKNEVDAVAIVFFGDAHLAVLEADDISKQRLVRVSSFQWRPLPPNITDVGGGQQAPRTFTDAGFTAVCQEEPV